VRKLQRLGFRGEARPELKIRARGDDWPALVRWPAVAIAVALLVPLLACLAVVITVGVLLSMTLGFFFWLVVTCIVVVPLHAFLQGLA
jgi:hypothetical protein